MPDSDFSHFFRSLFREFEDQGVLYGVFGNYEGLPAETTNDVDIWVYDFAGASLIVHRLADELGFTKFIENRLPNGANLFFYKVLESTIIYIHVDLMTNTSWKSTFELLSKEDLLRSLTRFRDFYVVDKPTEAVGHLLYPLVTFGRVREKYKQEVSDLAAKGLITERLEQLLGKELTCDVLEAIAQGNWSYIEKRCQRIRWRVVYASMRKEKFGFLLLVFRYLSVALGKLLRPSGKVIALVGNDGCGKTTLLNLIEGSSSSFSVKHNCRFYYWRPYMLPEIRKLLQSAAKQPSVPSDRDMEKAKTGLLGFLKLGYYILDYLVGWTSIYACKSRGGLVVFDRYYDDLIVYPERFGICLSEALIRKMRYFVPQPDLIIYPSADAINIKARKDELPTDELNRQISCYLELCKTYENVVAVDADADISKVFHEVQQRILNLV